MIKLIAFDSYNWLNFRLGRGIRDRQSSFLNFGVLCSKISVPAGNNLFVVKNSAKLNDP